MTVVKRATNEQVGENLEVGGIYLHDWDIVNCLSSSETKKETLI